LYGVTEHTFPECFPDETTIWPDKPAAEMAGYLFQRPITWFERDAENFGRVVFSFTLAQEVVRAFTRLMKAVGMAIMMYGMYLVGNAPVAFTLYMIANTSVGMLASIIEEIDALALVASGWRVYDETP